MADARALLRQQREARRITHPHASYSEAGKLICTLCRETVKNESLWKHHIKSDGHRARAQPRADQTPPQPADATAASTTSPGGLAPPIPDGPPKRKFDAGEEGASEDAEEALRRKRSRADMGTPSASSPTGSGDGGSGAPIIIDKYRKEDRMPTPPSGGGQCRPPVTPSHGIEILITSRPATPAMQRDGSASSTPGAGPSTHQPQSAAATALQPGNAVPSPNPSTETSGTPALANAPADTNPPAAADDGGGGAAVDDGGGGAAVDEDEWAAFEAGIEAMTAPYSEDAVISAPAMTAEESEAAKNANSAADGQGEQRRGRREREILDEREEATRALEQEFDEMEALEARLRLLKDRREELRRLDEERKALEGSESAETGADDPADQVTGPEGDEDEDDEDDEWDGFRFQA